MITKKDARTFRRQMEAEQSAWPADLVKLGNDALFNLNFIADNNPKIIEAIKKNAPSVWTDTIGAITKFETEYAAFKRAAAA